MGVLFYAEREDHDGGLFALNKAHQYSNLAGPHDEWLTVTEAVSLLRSDGHDRTDWFARVEARLAKWADGHRLRVLGESTVDEMDPTPVITGSAFDEDYEAEGVTYIPGSAW